MKKLSYLLLLAGVGSMLTSCEEKKDYFDMDTLDGIGMVIRSISVEEGSNIKPIDAIYVDYNNLVGINNNSSAMVNGTAVQVYVNPENGMQLVIPVNCEWNTDYSVSVPEGLVYRSDDVNISGKAFSVTFSTNFGLNRAKVDRNLTNSNATPEAKALYAELLENYGKVMYSGAMGGVAWETGYTDYIASVNDGAGYPKIVGFDYLHLASSPSNWINYGDISPVKEIWDAGSVPTITWHWNVPEVKTGSLYPFKDTDGSIEMPGDWSGNLQIPASYFSYAKEGNVVTVNISEVTESAQGSFKNGSTWGGLIDGDTNYDYFNLATTDEEGNIELPSSFSLVLTSNILNEVKTNGLIVSGHDYTLVSVDFDGIIVNSDLLSYNNTFSPLQVLTPGTIQNEIAEADIQKLAGYMKLLQDANIPVLFRPFHEAAGDYTWGPWFWWGQDGVDATKKLWNYLRTKLEDEYVLNNLIWVWTVQTSSAGEFASVQTIRNAYPGNDVVDIVGTDLYPDIAMTDQSEQFSIVNSMVEGRKIVTLSEIGNLIDPAVAAENNCLWSYFMNWYDFSSPDVFGFGEWNTQSVFYDGKDYSNPWAAVANSPFVINR